MEEELRGLVNNPINDENESPNSQSLGQIKNLHDNFKNDEEESFVKSSS